MQDRSTTDSSVIISLADLTRVEEERVQREELERVRAREQRERREREAQARLRADEEARIAAIAEASAERTKQEAMERALVEARQRAEIDVARIQAEAKARLEVDNAVRAHELAELRVRRETGRRRREYVLGAALALAACVSGFIGFDASHRVGELERAGVELRDRERALSRERDDAKRTELEALDRRHRKLASRPLASAAGDVRKTAEAARSALDASSPRRDQLRAFAESLDALESRLETVDQLAALDRRSADLAAWAASTRRGDDLDAVKTAAARARAPGASSETLVAYETALDRLRQKLAARAGVPGQPMASTPTTTNTTSDQRRCHPSDPGCGIDGRPVF